MSGLSPIGVTIIPKNTGSIPKPSSQAGKNKVTWSAKEKELSMFNCMIIHDINFLNLRDCVALNLVSTKSYDMFKNIVKQRQDKYLIDFDKLFNLRDPKQPRVNVFYSQGGSANILLENRDGFFFNSGNINTKKMSIQGLQIWTTLHKERARFKTKDSESESKEINESFECAFCTDRIAYKELNGLESKDPIRITHEKCETTQLWSKKDAIMLWGFSEVQLYSILSVNCKTMKSIRKYTTEDLSSFWSYKNIVDITYLKVRISERQKKQYQVLPKKVKSCVNISEDGEFVRYNRTIASLRYAVIEDKEEQKEEECKKRQKIGEEEFHAESYLTPPSGPSKATVEVPPFDLDTDES